MKKLLSLAFAVASLAPAALADFYEGFDGERFPPYWKYNFFDFNGIVDWQMGGGVAKATRIQNWGAELYTPFNVFQGTDYVFTGRFGWDTSPDTRLSIVLGSIFTLHAFITTTVLNGTRILTMGTQDPLQTHRIYNPGDGWHDFEIAQTGGEVRFKIDGTHVFTAYGKQPLVGSIVMTFNNKDSEPMPPVYLDYLSVQAVPEPASLAALGIGLAVIARRRITGAKR